MPFSSSRYSEDEHHKKKRNQQRQGWDNVAKGWQKWWKIFENGAQTISDKLIEIANIKNGSNGIKTRNY